MEWHWRLEVVAMIDLNHASGAVYGGESIPNISEEINSRINSALVARNSLQARRTYIQTSRIGEECSRMIQYEYMATPLDPDREFDGGTIRIFDRGHKGEDEAAEWLRLAGYNLRTESNSGKQFGFSALGGRFSGHIDGVILGANSPSGMKFPCLWETKTLGNKAWNLVVKNGVKQAKPVYYAQVQIYQAYMELHENPALFTAMNADTRELWCEMVPFDSAVAQALSDKAVAIAKATEAGELMPRVAANPSWFACKWCNFAARCWGEKS